MDTLVKLVMLAVLLVALAIWSVVGLIFWIPLLIRATAAFSASLVHSAITAQKPTDLGRRLETAAGFYFNGFINAFAVFAGDLDRTTKYKEVRLHIVLLEVVWAILAWAVVFTFTMPGFGRDIMNIIGDGIRLIFSR